MPQQHTHLSLRFKQDLWILLLAAVIIPAGYVLIQYFFYSVEMKDLQFVIEPLLFVLLTFWFMSFDAVKISDKTIGSYGFFHVERKLDWESIRQVTLIDMWGKEVKPGQPLPKRFATIYLSSSEEKISRRKPNDKSIVRVPYRQDIYELILEKTKKENIS